MRKISGFTFGHNCIAGGYPIVEAVRAVENYVDEVVFVNMESTDNTEEVVLKLGCSVIQGKWGNKAGETLREAHALHSECLHDQILHFEADEVYAPYLVAGLFSLLVEQNSVSVPRVQVSQNFQRIREYPIWVHRGFKKGAIKDGRSTTTEKESIRCTDVWGYLWDCCYCFRDNVKARNDQNTHLWTTSPLRLTPKHFLDEPCTGFLETASDYWEWKTTPLRIPEILIPLVGVTKYKGLL